ncbi:hypothetical protein NQZ79_g5240 [Umbelopsis isabellina]|nr:hypothetical protein NQZ79_g5240 [Umbelopsis isabellina]
MKRSRDVQIEEDVQFDALIKNKDLLKGIKASGYEKPSPIQLKAIPLGRLGVDLIAQAKSGTGKTVVFGTIALECVDLSLFEPQILIVAPTREIAVQITEVLRVLGTYMQKLTCETFIGGLAVGGDTRKMKQCQVVVGTPGRLMALLQQNKLKVANIKLAVLDEADKLMGADFKAQSKYILEKLPIHKQVIAFSATFDQSLYDTFQQFMKNPQKVVLTTDAPVLEGVQQYHIQITTEAVDTSLIQIHEYEQKFKCVVDILEKVPFYQCIVFLNHRGRAVDLTQWLNRSGWETCHISAGISQQQRLEVMQKARKFRIRVLICSDLIARGIDIDRVNLVINLDFPKDVETYLHRVGRTGRYGTSGIAINVTSSHDEGFLKTLGEHGINIESLPENLTFGAFAKELEDSERKTLEQHEKKRQKTVANGIKLAKKDAIIKKPSKRQLRQAGVQDNNVNLRLNDNTIPQNSIDSTCSASQSTVKQPPLFVDANQTTCSAQPCADSFPPAIYRGYYHSHSEKSLDPPDLFF